MASRADQHDRDKLLRWRQDWAAAGADAPPVCAIFLVSGADTAAHDVFRVFRRSFEERQAGFAHLVIFGQHGISATVRALQAVLKLPAAQLPVLLWYAGDAGIEPSVAPLPPGTDVATDAGPDAAWPAALQQAEEGLEQAGADSRQLRALLLTLCDQVICPVGACQA